MKRAVLPVLYLVVCWDGPRAITSTTISHFTAGLALFRQDILERPNVCARSCHDRLRPPVLLFQLPQPAYLEEL